MITGNKRFSLVISLVMILVFGSLCILVFLAPYLASRSRSIPAAFIYLFFAPLCHQTAGRSFHAWGKPLAVCHRCAGIYFGMFLFSLLTLMRLRLIALQRSMPSLIVAAGVPLALDALLPHLGLWTNTPLSRFLSGVLFGSMMSMLLYFAGK